jgi:lipoprotein NlpI
MKSVGLAALITLTAAAPAYAASYDNLNAGIQLYNTGNWSGAIEQFDKALAADDLVPSLRFIAHFDRAQSHMRLLQFGPAIDDYSASLALRPSEVQALTNRASAYAATGKLDQAAADLDGAIAARPKLGFLYGMRAALNIRRGQADKSREDMRTSLALLPERASGSSGIGIANWIVGQLSDAEKNFSDATDKDDTHAIYGWLWYALTEARLGKTIPRRALPDFDLKTWPGPIVNLFLGNGAQEAVFAAAAQGEANAVNGQICEANFYVGEWLLQHHDQAGAKPLINKAASDCPTNFIEWMPAQMDQAGLSE